MLWTSAIGLEKKFSRLYRNNPQNLIQEFQALCSNVTALTGEQENRMTGRSGAAHLDSRFFSRNLLI